MPRTSKLNDVVQAKILEAVEAGMHLHRAALYGGISETTFYEWMRKGETAPGEGDVDLTNLGVKELRAIAKEAGLATPPRAKRSTIVEMLEANGIESWDRYRRFREAVLAGEVEAEMRAVLSWQLGFEKNPTAPATFLARRHPKDWAPETNVRLKGDADEPIEVSVDVAVDQNAMRKLLLADPAAAALLDELAMKIDAAAEGDPTAVAS